MGVVFVLYDKTDNIMYYADKLNHDEGWSDFIISKNPAHEYVKTADNEDKYFNIIEKAESQDSFEEIDLLEQSDDKGRFIYHEWLKIKPHSIE